MLKKGPVMYEEMIRVPLLIVPPEGAAASKMQGMQCSQLVSHIDILPTVLDYSGIRVPCELQGRSLLPVLEGRDMALRDGLAVEYHSVSWGEKLFPLRAWRTRQWKYVEGIHGDNELYDLENDPLETANVIDLPQYAPAQQEMKDSLERWLRRTGDAWPHVPAAEILRELKPGPWEKLAEQADAATSATEE